MENRVKLMNKYFDKSGIIKDYSQITTLIDFETNEALKRSKSILSLDNIIVSKPLVIMSPNFSDDKKIRIRVLTENNTIRYDYDYALLTTIFLNEERLFYHQTALEYVNGEIEYDYTGEIRLSHIVNVETKLFYENDKNPVVTRLVLILKLINNDKIEFTLRNHYLYQHDNILELLTDDEKYIIETIKKYIRNSK